MALSDVLSGIGTGLEKVGKVAGAVAEPLAKGIATEEAGYAPQIAQEKRQHAQSMEDAQLAAQEKVLGTKLSQLQSSAPLYKPDGTLMTPAERTQAISALTDQYTQLYAHPKHAPKLMEKLRQIVHPNGATAGSNQIAPSSPAGAMSGFTAAPSPTADDTEAAAHKKATDSIEWFKKTMLPMFPAEQQAEKLNAYIDHINGITGREVAPKEDKLDQAGIFSGSTGKYYTSQMLESGNAPKELIDRWASQKKAEQGKLDEAAKKKKEADDEAEKKWQTHHKQELRDKESNAGTWALEEDPDTGKTVLFNSKTGEKRDAPSGLAKPGTAAKAETQRQKNVVPITEAMNYANDYLANKVFTGPGDEALQEKFFSMAKPASGFRMTQPQMDMLRQSRDWMGSLEAKARHATTGRWFSDKQIEQIVKTMNDLGKGIQAAQAKPEKLNTLTAPIGGVKPQLPSAAVAKLKEDHVTTFKNGQKWMLKNGQPEQVK